MKFKNENSRMSFSSPCSQIRNEDNADIECYNYVRLNRNAQNSFLQVIRQKRVGILGRPIGT